MRVACVGFVPTCILFLCGRPLQPTLLVSPSVVVSQLEEKALERPTVPSVPIVPTFRLAAPGVRKTMSANTPAKSTPVSATKTASGTTVVLGGRTHKVRDQARPDVDLVHSGVVYRKEDRANMDHADKQSHFEKACRPRATKFDLMSLSLEDDGKLDATYNLSMLIGLTRANHTEYDMHDVMTIVVCDDAINSNPVQEIDLYSNYTTVTPEMAALSNKWFNRWSAEDTACENLDLTYKYFVNNCSMELLKKVNEEYLRHSVDERGGPLFFILMMKQLLSNSEAAILDLQRRIKTIDLSKIPGENVSKAVSLARGAIARLETLSKVPEDIVRTLLAIFQTSSVPAFNAVFEHLERERTISLPLGALAGRPTLTAEHIFQLAELQYRQLVETSAWNGVADKRAESVFKAAGATSGTLVCWNCGAGHHLRDCPKPLDKARVKAAKKEFQKQSRASKHSKGGKPPSTGATTPGKGKWRKPEAGENNRRVINGSPHVYDSSAKRWFRDTAHLSAAPAPPPADTSAPAPAPAAAQASLAGAATDAARRAQVANLARQFQSVLDNL